MRDWRNKPAKRSVAATAIFCITALAGWHTIAYAYSPWEWFYNGNAYASEQQALAAMRGSSPQNALLTKFLGIDADHAEIDRMAYRYGVPDAQGIVAGEWRYSVLLPNTSSQFHSTEEAAVQATVQEFLFGIPQHPDCPVAVITITGTYQPSQFIGGVLAIEDGYSNQSGTGRLLAVDYYVRPQFTCQSGHVEAFVGKQRAVDCPQHYQGIFVGRVSWADYWRCGSPLTDSISKRRLTDDSCETTAHPIDVATGDKLLREVDYTGSGLQLVRTYHSQELAIDVGLGAGWVHNYAGRLLFNGVLPTGVILDDGRVLRVGQVFDDNGQPELRGLSASGYFFAPRQAQEDYVLKMPTGAERHFDTIGRLIRSVSASGEVTAIGYSGGRVASVTDPFGHGITFNYDDATQQLVSMTDPAGHLVAYEYVSIGERFKLTRSTRQDGSSRSYHYEDNNFSSHLTGLTDENGIRHLTVSYDTVGRAISSELDVGQEKVTVSFGPAATIVNEIGGGVTTYTFNDMNGSSRAPRKCASVARSGAGEQTRTYPTSLDSDPQRRPLQTSDANGNVTVLAYDGPRLSSLTEAVGSQQERTRTYIYADGAQRLHPTAIVEPDRTTTRAYDPNGNVLARTVLDTSTSESRTWTYIYNSFGQMLTANGPRTDVPDVTTYTYYSCNTGFECGQIHTVTDALSHTTTYNDYNAHGQPLTITDPNGVAMTLTYDLRQRLTSRTLGGEQTTFEYWPTGLLKKVTLADASFLQYTYDGAHRLTRIEDADGNHVVYTLDPMGNRSAEKFYDPSNALAQTRTRVFNTLNQLWKEIGAAGTPTVTTVHGYDNNGNETTINAPLGRSTTQGYDELNRLTSVLDPASGTTSYGYNPLDQLTSVTDPRGLITSYSYNALGDLLEQSSPDTGVTTHTYDSAGNLATRTDARGASIGRGTYSYDALNRVTQIQYPDHTITHSYDSCLNGVGRLCGMTDASGSTVFEYDPHGRVTRKSQSTPIGSLTHTRTVRYEYASGRLTALRMPEGQRINYSYDVAGRISEMSITWPDNSTSPLLSSVLYDPAGRVRGWTWANGTFEVREYDQDGRIIDIDNAGASQYGYDDADRITSITSLAGNTSPSWSYGYDLLDRLTGANRTGLAETFSYDANGNRLSQGGTQASTYSYSTPLTSNRLQSVAGALSRTYSYDAMGNITGNDIVSFGYNGAGRRSSAGSMTYRYNGLGERTAKSAWSNDLTGYLYDEAGHLLEKCDVSSAGQCASFFSTQYIWLDDIPVAALLPYVQYNEEGYVSVFYVGFYNVHTDHLNTPRRFTRRDDGAVVWQWDSDPFGVGLPNANVLGDPNAASDLDLRFPGQIFDSENWPWLHYNYFRDYDPQTGRYVESDPIGLGAGVNTYAYVLGDPIGLADPWGLVETPPSNIPGGPYAPTPDNLPGKFQGPPQPAGGRWICQYVPPEAQGGPPGSEGYWKYKGPTADWQRVDLRGNPITPAEAHPGRGKPPARSAVPIAYNPYLMAIFSLFYSAPAE